MRLRCDRRRFRAGCQAGRSRCHRFFRNKILFSASRKKIGVLHFRVRLFCTAGQRYRRLQRIRGAQRSRAYLSKKLSRQSRYCQRSSGFGSCSRARLLGDLRHSVCRSIGEKSLCRQDFYPTRSKYARKQRECKNECSSRQY